MGRKDSIQSSNVQEKLKVSIFCNLKRVKREKILKIQQSQNLKIFNATGEKPSDPVWKLQSSSRAFPKLRALSLTDISRRLPKNAKVLKDLL